MSGYTCEILLTESCEVGRQILNPDLLQWEDPSYIWDMPFGDSLYEGYERRKHLHFDCFSLLQVERLLLETISLRFQCILKITKDIQPHGLNN